MLSFPVSNAREVAYFADSFATFSTQCYYTSRIMKMDDWSTRLPVAIRGVCVVTESRQDIGPHRM